MPHSPVQLNPVICESPQDRRDWCTEVLTRLRDQKHIRYERQIRRSGQYRCGGEIGLVWYVLLPIRILHPSYAFVFLSFLPLPVPRSLILLLRLSYLKDIYIYISALSRTLAHALF